MAKQKSNISNRKRFIKVPLYKYRAWKRLEERFYKMKPLIGQLHRYSQRVKV